VIAAKAALEKHAEDVAILDVGALSSVTSFFVIGTAESQHQLQAVAEEIQDAFQRHGQRVWHIEGATEHDASGAAHRSGISWVLIDGGDVVIHLFNPPGRTFYSLERLWADAPRIPLETHV